MIPEAVSYTHLRAEEHGTVDLIDHHVLRHMTEAALRILLVLHILPLLDHRHIGHPCHKQQAGQGQAHADGHHQVENHCEEEGKQQHRRVALGGAAHHLKEGPPAAHIIGHHQQDGGDAGHGDQGRQGHKEQDVYKRQG